MGNIDYYINEGTEVFINGEPKVLAGEMIANFSGNNLKELLHKKEINKLVEQYINITTPTGEIKLNVDNLSTIH